MSDATTHDDKQEMPPIQGHTIGFIDTSDSLAHELIGAGFPGDKIQLFQGQDGLQRWEQMMKGSLWGESAEKVYHAGEAELQAGHSAIIVEVQDSDQAAVIAEAAKRFGGHGFYHFGYLADTRLTP
jgi:hypothetical protein